MPSPRLLSLVLICALCAVSTGCNGVIGDPAEGAGGGSPGDRPGGLTTPPADSIAMPTPFRRLTHAEYQNAVRDLFAVDIETIDLFGPDEKLGYFSVNRRTTVDEGLAEGLMIAASQVAERAVASPDAFLPCPVSALDETCVGELIDRVAPRAFRRDPDPALRAALLDVYRWGSTEYDAVTGLETLILGILSSPDFLYRLELFGEQVDDATILLDHWEIASRLSFFLWESIPDDELVQAARDELLHDPAEVERQARRMLADPRAEATFVDFHQQWMGVEDILGVSKSMELFPDFDEALVQSMERETELFLGHVLREEGANVEALLAAPVSFVDARLAEHYGLTPPSSGEFERRETPGRVGFLSRGSWLTMHAHPNKTSPTFRGLWIRENLVCRSLPDPPPDIVPPELVEGESTRQRQERILAQETCYGCHQFMDLAGFAFESFDAIGAHRDFEGAVPIDTTGELRDAGEVSGAFDDAAGLAQRLSASDEVKRCIVQNWFQFAFGRLDEDGDIPSIDHAFDRFRENDWDIRELLVAVTQTDAFYYRAPVE